MSRKWRQRVGLRVRVLGLLTLLVMISVAGGSVMIWYTNRMDKLVRISMDEIKALEMAESLMIELTMEKGVVSYYVITGEEEWLREMEKYRGRFWVRLNEVKAGTGEEKERALLEALEHKYDEYSRSKEEVIRLYKANEGEKGAELHGRVRSMFIELTELAERFAAGKKEKVEKQLSQATEETEHLRILAGTAMVAVVFLGVLLGMLIVLEILEPLQKLALETVAERSSLRPGDDLHELKERVRGLRQEADFSRQELARSRERLFQSEKMAVIGKLAADIAHSIRNPMASIKMRLFSLERSLELSPTQKEDFAVVAEEMRRLDNIVRNFLEFSRPPTLEKRRVDMTEILSMTIQLLQHQLERSQVKLAIEHRHPHPVMEADPELLKEVLVNFIVNACEAMPAGGTLRITVEEPSRTFDRQGVAVRIADTGPGVPAALREKIFEPFFSTKEGGTGLGLSIALRIIEEHGGWVELVSAEGKGAEFVITLPGLKEEGSEFHSDRG